MDIAHHNKGRDYIRTYKTGETIYVRIDKRLGSKLTPKYKKEIVQADNNTTIKTRSGKIVHKNNIKT